MKVVIEDCYKLQQQPLTSPLTDAQLMAQWQQITPQQWTDFFANFPEFCANKSEQWYFDNIRPCVEIPASKQCLKFLSQLLDWYWAKPEVIRRDIKTQAAQVFLNYFGELTMEKAWPDLKIKAGFDKMNQVFKYLQFIRWNAAFNGNDFWYNKPIHALIVEDRVAKFEQILQEHQHMSVILDVHGQPITPATVKQYLKDDVQLYALKHALLHQLMNDWQDLDLKLPLKVQPNATPEQQKQLEEQRQQAVFQQFKHQYLEPMISGEPTNQPVINYLMQLLNCPGLLASGPHVSGGQEVVAPLYVCNSHSEILQQWKQIYNSSLVQCEQLINKTELQMDKPKPK